MSLSVQKYQQGIWEEIRGIFVLKCFFFAHLNELLQFFLQILITGRGSRAHIARFRVTRSVFQWYSQRVSGGPCNLFWGSLRHVLGGPCNVFGRFDQCTSGDPHKVF